MEMTEEKNGYIIKYMNWYRRLNRALFSFYRYVYTVKWKSASGYLSVCEGIYPPKGIYTHISGIDLVEGKDNRMEDILW